MFSKASPEDLRAILTAYRTVKNGSWPQMHAAMDRRLPHWALASEAELAAELEAYLKDSDAPDGAVRVFWKLGPKFLFAGCNERFARDARHRGLRAHGPRRLRFAAALGRPGRQISRGRHGSLPVAGCEARHPRAPEVGDRVTSSGSASGKAPILAPDGSARGILGMYDILDDKTASKLFFARSQAAPKS